MFFCLTRLFSRRSHFFLEIILCAKNEKPTYGVSDLQALGLRRSNNENEEKIFTACLPSSDVCFKEISLYLGRQTK